MEERRKVVGIFDADFIPFYVCHNKEGEPEKTLEDCLNLCDNLINNMLISIKADMYYGFITKGRCFRYRINPDYKGNRKYDQLPKYLTNVKEHLEKFHNFTYDVEYEADDLVVSLRDTLLLEYNPIIITPDKDITKNIPGTHYNPKKNEFIYTSVEEANINFWISTLTGDTTDNIKGCKGIGIKKAEAIIKSSIFTDNYKNLVLDAYVKTYGEYLGIQEFTKNYLSLKIINDIKMNYVKLNTVNIISGEYEEKE